MKTLLFLFSFIFSAMAFSYCGKSKIHIFFANGMFNSRVQALESYKSLSEQNFTHPEDDFEVIFSPKYLAYNTSEPLLIQLFEVARQKSKEVESKYWSYLADSDLAPQWFQEMSAGIQRGIAFDEAMENKDLQMHIQAYSKLLEKPENHILTVAHSQGNFFTNFAFKALNIPKNRFRMKMISLATPAGEVYGYGPYINLKSDCVVNRMPGALPTNFENSPEGLCDHEFVKNYLNGNNSGGRFTFYFMNEVIHFSGLRDGVKLPTEATSLSNWLRKFDPLKYNKIIQPHQCLAIRVIYSMRDRRWNDVKCDDRGRSGFVIALNDCLTKDKIDGEGLSYCPVMFGISHNTISGLFEDISSEAKMNNKFSSHSECNWKKNEFIKDNLSQELIEKAVKFYEDPWSEIPLLSEYTSNELLD